MNRQYIPQLLGWKNKGSRRPLVIEGARGVGKTWLLRELGRTGFSRTLYIDIESDKEACTIFRSISNAKQLISTLEHTYTTKIDAETLLILDEAGFAPDIFYRIQPLTEEIPWLHIAVACSLSGIALKSLECATDKIYSYPGNVTHIKVNPLTFHEFLTAIDHDQYLENSIDNCSAQADDILKQDMLAYMYVGGMPQCVSMYAQNAAKEEIRKCQSDIIANYDTNFSKIASSCALSQSLRHLWTYIASGRACTIEHHLASISSTVDVNNNIYDIAYAWLQDAFLTFSIETVYDVRKRPLKGYADINTFRAYPLDIGLLSATLDLQFDSITDNSFTQSEKYAVLAAQFVAQELIASSDMHNSIFSWSSRRNTHHVDFVVDVHGNEVLPVAIADGETDQSSGLSEYLRRYSPRHGILATSSCPNLSDDSRVTRIPLYAISSYLRNLTAHN